MKIIRNIIGIVVALTIIMMPVSAIDTYENDQYDSGANILAGEHNHESDEEAVPIYIILDSGVLRNVNPRRNIVGTRQICYIDGEGCNVCSYFKPTDPMVISHTFSGGIMSSCTICGYKKVM